MNNEIDGDFKSLKVSIIIPTRERSATLIHALRTCTEQTYAPLEIIVSDNYSQDNTKDVVESFRDSRIKYINTGERLSMSHNWEFALDYVTGDFITYVGDDDGLMPEAISDLVKIIERTKIKAISWRWASYYWPNCIHNASHDLLIVPLWGHCEERNTAETLAKVINFECGYQELPFLYKGIIKKDVIDTIRKLSGGSFFHSVNPDMYSAIAISAMVDSYIYSTIPFSLNGTSLHSNGASQFNLDVSGQEANKFNSENNIAFHSDLVIAPSHPICVAECFLQARNHLPSLSRFTIDMSKMIMAAYEEVSNTTEWRYNVVKKAVIEIAARHKLNELATKLFGGGVSFLENQRASIGLTPGVNLYHKQVIVRCDSLGVSNIYGASILCRILLERRKAHLNWSILDLFITMSTMVFLTITKKLSLNFKR